MSAPSPVDPAAATPAFRPPIWLAALSRLPFWWWYAIAGFLAWLAIHVVRYRPHVVDAQLRACFPEFDEPTLARVKRDFYRGFADVLVETIKSPALSADDVRARVSMEGVELVRRHIEAGQPVLLVTSHTCNWEWSLLALSVWLGCPLDVAYKPLHDAWAERLFLGLRARLGARLVPAKDLLMDVMKRRRVPRVVAVVADQDPVTANVRHFTSFLGRDTAFYVGPEAIARAARMPVLYLDTWRVARGRYVLRIEPLAEAGEQLPEGAVTERYARRLERAVRERPADWLWTYRRWKVKRSLYS